MQHQADLTTHHPACNPARRTACHPASLASLHPSPRFAAHVKKHEESLRRAFRDVLTLIDGARKYMSLDRLAGSSAVHALLVAAGHARTCFLKNGFEQMGGNMSGVHDVEMKRKLTLAHVVFMDEVAQAMKEDRLKVETVRVLSEVTP